MTIIVHQGFRNYSVLVTKNTKIMVIIDTCLSDVKRIFDLLIMVKYVIDINVPCSLCFVSVGNIEIILNFVDSLFLQVEDIQKMDSSIFGEGLTLLNNRCKGQILLHFTLFFSCADRLANCGVDTRQDFVWWDMTLSIIGAEVFMNQFGFPFLRFS